jgi:hypothetical protein
MAGGKEELSMRITYGALVERNKLLLCSPHSSDPHDESRDSGRGCSGPTMSLEKQRRQKKGQDQTRAQSSSGKRSKSKQEHKGSERHAEGTHRSVAGSHGDRLNKTAEHGDRSSVWSQYEHRRVEKALSKWSGDPAKLDPVIRAW